MNGSKQLLLDLVKKRGTLSVDEAVREMKLAKTTLREHFLQLERDGLVRRSYHRSGPGRPRLQYEITAEGNRFFPSQESLLLRQLLSWMKAQEEEETLEAFFQEFWSERLKKARIRMDAAAQDDPEKRLAALRSWLKEEGFMPEFELDKESGRLLIRECNCPFREVVKETLLPCHLESEFYHRLFDRPAERLSFIAEGDHACTYSIFLKESGEEAPGPGRQSKRPGPAKTRGNKTPEL